LPCCFSLPDLVMIADLVCVELILQYCRGFPSDNVKMLGRIR
jgi:hypothetical protein